MHALGFGSSSKAIRAFDSERDFSPFAFISVFIDLVNSKTG